MLPGDNCCSVSHNLIWPGSNQLTLYFLCFNLYVYQYLYYLKMATFMYTFTWRNSYVEITILLHDVISEKISKTIKRTFLCILHEWNLYLVLHNEKSQTCSHVLTQSRIKKPDRDLHTKWYMKGTPRHIFQKVVKSP